ncbi:hypothetical protein OD305_003847 [Salmonella enterica]|nr:hypothetical protein [Salmonella enterica]EJQ7405315.1 hypothetical protein [Salmonella enterica]EJX3101557.1 hypothetical protein [Salmonella enterica]EJX3111563.1 hypothetical protein [Salmonella enterica]EJX3319260.1 hypothetical protein [Salmonella enterica]
MQNENQNHEHRQSFYSDVMQYVKAGNTQGNVSALLAYIDNSPLVKDDKVIADVENKFNNIKADIRKLLSECTAISESINEVSDKIKRNKISLEDVNNKMKELSEKASEIILSGDLINIEEQNGLAFIAGGEIAKHKISEIISELNERRNELRIELSDKEDSLRTKDNYAARLYAEIQARKFFLVVGCLVARIYEISPYGRDDGAFNPDSWDSNVFIDLLKSLRNIECKNLISDDVLNQVDNYAYNPSLRASPFSIVRERNQKHNNHPGA